MKRPQPLAMYAQARNGQQPTYTVAELFCGCGGFSHGFKRSGRFRVVLGNDIKKHALATFALNHTEDATSPAVIPEDTDGETAKLKAELMLFFKLLSGYGAEFGFRVGKEMARFLHFHKKLSGGTLDFRAAMDAQIVQKLLPKLHGSRNRLTGVLWALAALCEKDHAWKAEADEKKRARMFDDFMQEIRAAIEAGDEKFDPAKLAEKLRAENKEPLYPLSFDKIARMWAILEANGFVSFAEA